MKRNIAIVLILLLLAAGCKQAESPAVTDVPDVPADAAAAQEATEEPDSGYTAVTVTVRRDAQTASEQTFTDPDSLALAEQIVLSHMVLSAAWEGVEASELEDFIRLSCVRPDGTEEVYYQYDTDGRHVLQTGEDGMYTILLDQAYAQLCTLAGLTPPTEIGPDAAAALLEEKFGKVDEQTGNTFSFAYLDTLERDGTAYYRFRVSWLVDGDHLSYLTDYLVAMDGSALMEYVQDEALPEAYAAIIAQYADGVKNAYYQELSPELRPDAFGADVALEWSISPQQPYYALSDLDGDGTQELLMLSGQDTSALTFYDLWTLSDGKAVRPLDMDFGYRVNFDVYADGVLAVRWSNSAFESGCDFYRLEGASAEIIGSLVVASDPETPETMRCTLNGSELTQAEYEEQLAEFASSGMLPLDPIPITAD